MSVERSLRNISRRVLKQMNTLDQWETEAKIIPYKDIAYDNSKEFGQRFTEYSGDRKILIKANERILALIELVRKKDAALKFYAGNPTGIGREWSEYHASHVCDAWSGGHGLLDYQGDHYDNEWDRAVEALALTEQLK